ILASFPLLTIDVELETLKTCLKPVGEVITYLPGAGGNDPERIDLEVMLGSPHGIQAVLQATAGAAVEVLPVPRKEGTGTLLPVPAGTAERGETPAPDAGAREQRFAVPPPAPVGTATPPAPRAPAGDEQR